MPENMASFFVSVNGEYAQKQNVKIVNIVQNNMSLLKFVCKNDTI